MRLIHVPMKRISEQIFKLHFTEFVVPLAFGSPQQGPLGSGTSVCATSKGINNDHRSLALIHTMKSMLILCLTRLWVIFSTATLTRRTSAAASRPNTSNDKKINILTEEDDVGFWTRFLSYHKQSSTSMSAPPPTDDDTCGVDVTLECRIGDGTELPCDQYQPTTSKEDEDCTFTLDFTIRVRNVGDTVLDITQLSWTTRGGSTNGNSPPRNILDRLSSRTLSPNELSESIQFSRQDNICRAGTYRVSVYAESSSPSGGPVCDAEDSIQLGNGGGSSPITSPTPRPSPLPTRIPVLQPTRPPTRLPTRRRITAMPTREPTPLRLPEIDCSVTVELACQTTKGQPCESSTDLIPETAVCDVGQAMDAVTFTYQGLSCNALGNSQGPNSTCQDLAPILFDDAVTIQCRDASNGARLLVQPSRFVEPGDAVTVSGLGGLRLPEAIYCTVQDVVDGRMLQNSTIATSGTVRLDLGDEFGALRLAGCDRGDGRELSCFDIFSYHVVVRNDGETNVTLTRLDFAFHGMDLDLLPVLQIRTETVLLPGTSAVISTSSQVNICDTRVFMAVIDVAGEPPNGDSCVDRAELR
jgi:hypothetical protein